MVVSDSKRVEVWAGPLGSNFCSIIDLIGPSVALAFSISHKTAGRTGDFDRLFISNVRLMRSNLMFLAKIQNIVSHLSDNLNSMDD